MATQFQLLLNMIAASFGTGILSMPWSTAGASIIPAVVIVLVVALTMKFTISILIDAGEHHKKYELGSLLCLLPGSAGTICTAIVNVCLWGSLWLTLVGYVITIQDALQDFVPDRVMIAFVSSAIILPLCFLDLSQLAFTSSLSMLTTMNVAVITSFTLAQKSQADTLPDVCWYGFNTRGLISMVNMSCTSMIIQMCALPMYAELEEKTPQKFKRVTSVAFTALFFVYAVFSVIGYLTFGQGINSNIIKELPKDSWGNASRISYVIVIMSAYPMFVYPMIASLRSSEFLRGRLSGRTLEVSTTEGAAQEDERQLVGSPSIDRIANIATVIIVVSAMCLALVMDDLGFVNGLVGACQCAVFVGICPGLVGIYLIDPEARCRSYWKPLMVVLFIVCCAIGGTGMVFTDNYAKDLAKTCNIEVGVTLQ